MMARYDYMCDECGHTHEETHGMMEEPVIKCPFCKDSIKHKVPCKFITDVRCTGFVGKLGL